MHWICPLYKLSTCWAQWTPCWEVLSLVESNLKLVKRSTRLNISFVPRSSMCGSTKSSAFAQQCSTCWAQARAVPSESKSCYSSFASFPCSLQCPRSWTLSLCCCSSLYCFNAECTLLFYQVVFLPFCPHQWVSSLAVEPSIFVFWGDEYTSDSLPWFNFSLCEIFGMLNMLSHCWGHLNTPLDHTSTQHVESLCSGQIQCICTRLKSRVHFFAFQFSVHVFDLVIDNKTAFKRVHQFWNQLGFNYSHSPINREPSGRPNIGKLLHTINSILEVLFKE